MTRAFVTGGSGFVGRNLIPYLVDRGLEVRALARSSAAAAAIQELGGQPVAGDLGDPAALRAGMTGCELVFHAAAKVADWGPRAEFQRDTIDGTAHVLAAAEQAGVRRLVHVSTEAVLVGGGPIVNADETRPLPARPLGLYPWSKGRAEELVRAAPIDAVIVRPRFVWGRGDTVLLPRLVDLCRKGKFAWIGGGRHLTSTVHVKNVAHGLWCAAERGRRGETYFVTDGEPRPMRAFLTAMLASQGVSPGERSVPFAVARAVAFLAEGAAALGAGPPVLSRTGVRLIGEEVTVNDGKARRELGYENVIGVEEGLAELRG
jgi:nucleoside-diphosphate-sugar epimerase